MISAQRSFAGGEIDPALRGHSDLAKYSIALATCRNFTVQKTSGATNRGGTTYVCEVCDSSKRTRVINFTFDDDAGYGVEIGHEYFRPLYQGAQIIKNWSYVIYASQAPNCTIRVQNPGAADGFQAIGFQHNSRVTFQGMVGMTELNGNTYRVKNPIVYSTGIVQFQIANEAGTAIDSTGFGLFEATSAAKAYIPTSITGISKSSPCIVGMAGHAFVEGDEISISGVGGLTEVNGRNFKVGPIAADTFELQNMDGTDFDSTDLPTYTSGGTADRVLTIPTPFQEDEIFDLNYVQVKKGITIAHPNYWPRVIYVYSGDDWGLIYHEVRGTIPVLGTYSVTTPGTALYYVATVVDPITFEESQIGDPVGAAGPDTISFIEPPEFEFRIYKKLAAGNGSVGIYGYIGSTGTDTFVDNTITPDLTIQPPYQRDILIAENDYPAVCGAFGGRKFFAAPNSNREQAYGSRVGNSTNFLVPTPITDDSPVDFTPNSCREIRHIVDVGALFMLATAGEWVIEGDSAGIIKPGEINSRQKGKWGASKVRPVTIGKNILYVQARGSVIRDLAPDFENSDRSIFSNHFFEGYTVVDMAHQMIPNSILWVVRNDGALLGLTYVKEHEIFAWHRHDTDGEVESVTVVPEDQEDVLYMVVKRTINGAEKRYIERMNNRLFTDIKDLNLLDCSLSYDGRNTDTTHTMTLSGGTSWLRTENLTLTSSAAFFSSSDVDNEIHIVGPDGTILRCAITAYSDSQHVTVRSNKTVPAAMRASALSDWTKAVHALTGLSHLEGKEVAVFADGLVVANPNISTYAVITVEDGAIELPACYGVIRVGLPYICDIETLDIDNPNGETLSDKKKLISQVTVDVYKTRGVWVGPKAPSDDDEDPTENLTEMKIRNTENYDDPVALKTGKETINIQPEWNSNGRVFLRQLDPLPVTFLSIMPAGIVMVGR